MLADIAIEAEIANETSTSMQPRPSPKLSLQSSTDSKRNTKEQSKAAPTAVSNAGQTPHAAFPLPKTQSFTEYAKSVSPEQLAEFGGLKEKVPADQQARLVQLLKPILQQAERTAGQEVC